MTFHGDMKRELVARFGKDNVTFYKGWDTQRRGINWKRKGLPLALMVHHTAGAATDSTDPKHKGNQVAADKPQADYVQTHYSAPAANFTLGRSGHLFVHSVYPTWHSGDGTFKGKAPYDSLDVPDDNAADYLLGVEVVSKGLKKDFTAAQKTGLGNLARACQAATGWKGFTKRLPNHKTWAGARKIDTRYPEETLIGWADKAA